MVRVMAILGSLCCLIGIVSSHAAEPTRVAAGVTWDGVTRRDAPALGAAEIKVLLTSETFSERWKAFRPEEKVPAVNFTDYFVVEIVMPGGTYTLFGLRLEETGMARVHGIGVLQEVAVPKGYGHTFAVFPRQGVKKVEGVTLPTSK